MTNSPHLLVSDPNGRIFEHPDLEATGMKGGLSFRLKGSELIKLPAGSQLFRLPNRMPVGYDPQTGSFVTVRNAFAIAAFAAPGHTLSYNASYREEKKAKPLPLFSYGACAGSFAPAEPRKLSREQRLQAREAPLRPCDKNALIIN